MSQPLDFNAIREMTAIEGLRLLLVQALYGKDDPTISWRQLIACAENLRGRGVFTEYLKSVIARAHDACVDPSRPRQAVGEILAYALSLTASQALREQEEREAVMRSELGQIRHILAGWAGELTDENVPIMGPGGYLSRARSRLTSNGETEKDALIEALRGALESLKTQHMHNCYVYGSGGAPLLGECHRNCQDRKRREALAITPPQALREREERVAALEKVAEAALRHQGTLAHQIHCPESCVELTVALAALNGGPA